MSFEECEQFKGRIRQICRGESGLGREKENKYRRSWGLVPIEESIAMQALAPEVVAMPSLVKRVAHFIPALINHIGDGMKTRTQEEMEVCLAVCEACKFFQKNYCTKCGCSVSIGREKFLNKIAWKSEDCPLNKWPK